ncbi:hypothetical protein MPER_09765, partial [Moniliophthora perniciosa FA553]
MSSLQPGPQKPVALPMPVKRASVNDTATIGFAAGTTGGSGGTQTIVRSLPELEAAVSGDAKKIVIIDGKISGNGVVKVGTGSNIWSPQSNTSILGAPGATLTGIGLRIVNATNVIIRNIKINKVLGPGDNIGLQTASNVWIDHVELWSDLDHDKDYYDGLLDITHGSTGVTVSNSHLRDHHKASLVGHSDSNKSQDVNIRVTYVGNYWKNLNSRTPSFRFGTGHIYNNYFENINDGINTRVGAQVLVENNVWV